MWREHALPRLQSGRLGVERATHTLRLTGIGESALVGLIGEEVLRAENPQVATYARVEAVDVVVSAESDDGRAARSIVADTVSSLRDRIGEYVFAEGEQTWVDALVSVLGARTLAAVEVGSGGQLLALLGSAPFLVHGELVRDQGASPAELAELADRARAERGADIGLALHVRQTRDTHVRLAIADGDNLHELERTAFQAGDEGRRRAALAACAALWETLRQEEST